MVQHAQGDPRLLRDVDGVEGLAGLEQAQEVERAVQRALLAAGADHGHRVPVDARRADDVPFVAHARQRGPAQRGDQGRAGRRAHHDRAVSGHRVPARHLRRQQTAQPAPQLRRDHAVGGRAALHDDRADGVRVRAPRGLRQRHVAQPEVVAGLGARAVRGREGGERGEEDEQSTGAGHLAGVMRGSSCAVDRHHTFGSPTCQTPRTAGSGSFTPRLTAAVAGA